MLVAFPHTQQPVGVALALTPLWRTYTPPTFFIPLLCPASTADPPTKTEKQELQLGVEVVHRCTRIFKHDIQPQAQRGDEPLLQRIIDELYV